MSKGQGFGELITCITESFVSMSQSFLSGNTASPSSLLLPRVATLATLDCGDGGGCLGIVDVMDHWDKKGK